MGHSEWKLHSAQVQRAARLGVKVGRREPILRVYVRARTIASIPCYWCKRLTSPEEREVDHIQPLSRGGDHMASNLCICCIECNEMKGDLLPREFLPIIELRRRANIKLRRRGLDNQLVLPYELPRISHRKGPRRATQLTLVKIQAS